MEEQDREEGVSIGEVCRIIGKKIWYLLGASALVAIIAVLIVQFLINPIRVVYSMTFEVDYPNRSSMQYPDGTTFNYRDIISESALEEAKATDERFANINVTEILEEDAISISAETEGTGAELHETGSYTIEAKGKYFRGEALASSYLRAVANRVVARVNAAVGRFNSAFYLETYDSVRSYSEQIDLLVLQKEYLLDQYELLVESFGENYEVVLDGKGRTLRSYFSEVNVTMDSLTEQMLRTDLAANGYRLREGDDFTNANIKELQNEKERNTAIINALEAEMEKLWGIYNGTAAGSRVSLAATIAAPETGEESDPTLQLDAFRAEIAALVKRNAEIDIEIAALNKSLSQGATEEYKKAQASFNTRITEQYNLLKSEADAYHAVASKLYEEESNVRFYTMKAAGAGETSTILAAVASFVIVFIIGAIVVYALDAKRRRAEKAQTAGGAPSPEPISPASAAPADTTDKTEKNE